MNKARNDSLNNSRNNSRNNSLIAEALEMLADPYYEDVAQFRPGLTRYLEDRIETGHFLRRFLENDLMGTLAHAHPNVSASQLRALATLINSSFPARSWGSPETVTAWLAEGMFLEKGEGGA